MSTLSQQVELERLMLRMADHNGADLDLAMMCGAVYPSELQAASTACLGCTGTADCESRLERGVEGIPDYCRNTALIQEVAELMAADN